MCPGWSWIQAGPRRSGVGNRKPRWKRSGPRLPSTPKRTRIGSTPPLTERVESTQRRKGAKTQGLRLAGGEELTQRKEKENALLLRVAPRPLRLCVRSEEHTSELQSPMY